MAEQIKIVIGAETGQATAAVNKFNDEISKMRPAVNSANGAVLGFNRVIQDLPFGFQGIANNITELPGLFRSLGAAAKESGQSIGRLLLSSLTGAGGIGFALSAVTTALTFASVGFGAWTRGMKSAGETAKESKKEIDGVTQAIGESKGQIQHVFALSNAIRDGNVPIEEKKRALEDLKRVNKSYFGDLEFEKGLYEKLAGRVSEYTKALILTNVQKARGEEVTKAAIEEQDLRRQLQDLDEQIRKRQELAKAKIDELKATGLINLAEVKTANDIIARDDKLLALGKQRLELYDKLGVASDKLGNLSIAFEDAVTAALKFKNVETPEHLNKIKEAIDNLHHAHILDPKDLELAQKIHDTINGIKPPAKQAAFGGAAPTTTPLLPINEASFFKPLSDAEKALDDFNAQLAVQMQAMKATLIEGFAEAFGTLVGGGGFHQALASFLGIIGTALQAIGKSAIEAGLAILTVKKALTALITNPYLLVAAGAAAIAVGAAIKAHVPKFAAGGIATKPTLGIFGEAGPEALIPLNKMNQMGGGFPERIELVARGKDLHAVLNKTNNSLNRIT